MRTRMLLLASVIAASTAVAAVETATAQGMQDHMGPGMMPGGTDQQPKDQGMMHDGMDQGMMHGGMGHGMMHGDMGQGMMHGGMGQGMMCPMMRSGMMQDGMMGREMMGSGMMRGGMGALFGSHVTRGMNLSVDDVRGYLASRLERLNNKRLKVGDINSGDGTITADIVTVDNSLVQRLKVDRYTGAITYED
jgi:hypothetical protein